MTFTRWVIAAALLLAAAPAVAQSTAPADPLQGVWVSQTNYPATLRGDLTVTRDGAHWRATIGDRSTQFDVANNQVRFDFAGHGGFRGALRRGVIDGFWLQPVARTEGRTDPTATQQGFASPLRIAPSGRNTWRAQVAPLEGPFTLYLRLFRAEDGALMGAFRNPENNLRGGASQFRVTHDGDALHFLARLDGAQEVRHEATLLHDPERLRIEWQDIGLTLDLVRPTPAQEAAFFPRAPGSPPYVYQRPPETGDGWRTARAADVGLDEAALTRAVQRLIDADPAARRPSLIHSMLVAHRGRLVLEEYFFGTDRDTVHDIRSAGKTFASVMLGAAMRDGVPIVPETHLYDLVAPMGPFANPDPRKAQITLAQLMTHTAGFDCDDNNDNSPGNEGAMQTQTAQPNWWKYTLDLPMAHEPGQRYAYCSANENLMGAALTSATHTSLPELFERTVARPLQFGRYYWNLMPNDEGYLGGGAFMRPRDLLKLGQTYLDGGVWNGRRIVNADWVHTSTQPRIEVSPETTGMTQEQFENFYSPARDGYAWHLDVTHSGDHAYPTYMATGNGGQLLIVIPACDLAVVFTGGNYMQGGIWLRWRDDIIGGQIIPAMRCS